MKKVAALGGSIVLVAGALILGVVTPAQAVPSCVSQSVTQSNNIFTITTNGTATNFCSYNVSGRWKYDVTNSNGGSTTYGRCTTLTPPYGPNASSTTTASGTIDTISGNGTVVRGWVNC